MRWKPQRAALLALAAAAGAGIALGAHAARSSPRAATVTTQTTTTTTTAQTTTQQVTTTAPPPAPKPDVIAWPRQAGWTDVLASIPAAEGRANAVTEARAAVRAGLDSVGVLASSRHRSLASGYWVVFSGVYATYAEAEAALADVQARGFAAAYPRYVS